MATGVYNQEYRTRFQDASAYYNLEYDDDNDPTLIADKAGYTVYIQAIVINVTTDNAATLTFQESTAAKVIHKTPASPGLGTFDTTVDFGPEGIPLTEGIGLVMVTSAAGLAAQIKVYAYRRLTLVGAA